MPRLDSKAMLAKLVSFDTTSRNSNLELINWVADYLGGQGIESKLILNPERTKANLFTTIGAAGNGGIVLSGHIDVVPVDHQPWTSDPWTLVERDGRVYGRGAADMKGFIAAVLSHVPDWTSGLAHPIHLALTYDEEVGCTGVGSMIDYLRASGIRPRAVIIGEPTEMKVVTRHKSGIIGTCTVKGVAGHSSQVHRTMNAVMHAAEIVAHGAEIGDELRAGPQDAGFEPPYSSLQINVFHGGAHHNVVPHECSFAWDHRTLPGIDYEAVPERLRRFAMDRVLPRMHAVAPETAIDFQVTARIPGLTAEPGSSAETMALRWAGSNRTEAVAFGTEAGYFQGLGIPTVVCGPGNIEQAHKPDEFLALDQLGACDRFHERMAQDCRAAFDRIDQQMR